MYIPNTHVNLNEEYMVIKKREPVVTAAGMFELFPPAKCKILNRDSSSGSKKENRCGLYPVRGMQSCSERDWCTGTGNNNNWLILRTIDGNWNNNNYNNANYVRCVR